MLIIFLLLLKCVLKMSASNETATRMDIYCNGPLLHTVQMAKIYQDSKSFVDMKMKFTAREILDNFNEFMQSNNDTPSRSDVENFVHNNFETTGQEFEQWSPSDWIPEPSFISRIENEAYQKWARDIHSIWQQLGRKLKPEVAQNQELYSIIWVPKPVIVPGGRFREFYYWDSYWIIKGLLHSEMYTTVEGMLENFLHIVDRFGFVPNGGRVYYLNRSQPPLLVPTVKKYLDVTKNFCFLETSFHILEREFAYWLREHTVNVEIDSKNYTLCVYGDSSKGPRPESYTEDMGTAAHFHDKNDQEEHFSELKAGAESGWDFSSRWFITNGTNKGNLTSIKTRSIIPVDLNAFIYGNSIILRDWCYQLGFTSKAEHYDNIATKWKEAVNAVLWHEEAGVWLDYDMFNGVKRDHFYPSNFAPLWTQCYEQNDTQKITTMVLDYLESKHLTNYPGGVPCSMEHTGEQWDYPNAWAPAQHILISGLEKTGVPEAQALARKLAHKWITSNFMAYDKHKVMLEKYDATIPGSFGTGGEYKIQLGFGWTNGVALDFLVKYFSK